MFDQRSYCEQLPRVAVIQILHQTRAVHTADPTKGSRLGTHVPGRVGSGVIR